jgi:glycosyltransferase involved in cell wall biosynthesis
MATNTISFVVPVLNSKSYLAQCLDSVVGAIRHHGAAELIVVDNGSTDGSYEMLLSQYGTVARVERIEEVTISAVRNFGARFATGKYLAFIDSDCVVPNDYVDRVVQTFESVKASATGCMVGLPPSPHWIEKTWQELHEHTTDGYVRFINSANFVVKRDVFEQTAGFDESLITGEDAEYCQRLDGLGFKVYESHSVCIAHLRNPKSLPAFFIKNVWHGLGMFGTFRLSWLDRPVIMTFAFIALTATGVGCLFLVNPNLGLRIGLLVLLSFFVPVVTVVYRSVIRGKLYRPLRATFLYWLYFAARSYALFTIAWRHLRDRGKPSVPASLQSTK